MTRSLYTYSHGGAFWLCERIGRRDDIIGSYATEAEMMAAYWEAKS